MSVCLFVSHQTANIYVSNVKNSAEVNEKEEKEGGAFHNFVLSVDIFCFVNMHVLVIPSLG